MSQTPSNDQIGIRPAQVVISAPDKLTIRTDAGVTVAGRFAVTPGGDLVVRAEGPLAGTDVVLLQGGQHLPLKLTRSASHRMAACA